MTGDVWHQYFSRILKEVGIEVNCTRLSDLIYMFWLNYQLHLRLNSSPGRVLDIFQLSGVLQWKTRIRYLTRVALLTVSWLKISRSYIWITTETCLVHDVFSKAILPLDFLDSQVTWPTRTRRIITTPLTFLIGHWWFQSSRSSEELSYQFWFCCWSSSN